MVDCCCQSKETVCVRADGATRLAVLMLVLTCVKSNWNPAAAVIPTAAAPVVLLQAGPCWRTQLQH